MAPNPLSLDFIAHSNRTRNGVLFCFLILLTLMLPSLAFGQDATDAIATTCGFATDVKSILNAISIIVVTIAVIFSGYQIAFAHKRIGDVAPVLIGAILIGAASQISTMFLKSSSSVGGGACPTTSTMTHLFNHYAAAMHLLTHYA